MIFIILFIIAILYLLHIFLYCDKNGKLVSEIPGPKMKFVLGHLMELLKRPAPLFYNLRKNSNIYTKIYRYQLPFITMVLTSNPEYIERVLASQKLITKEGVYKNIEPWLGTGLLTSTGQKWHNRRKILTPAFHFSILKEFCKIFAEHSEQLVEKLKETNGKEVEVLPFITNFALNTICESAMGINLDNFESTNDYKKSLYDFGKYMIYRSFRPWLQPSFLFNLSSVGRKQKKVLSTLHGFTTSVINERRKNSVKFVDKFDGDIEEFGKKKIRMAMLDLLLTAESEGKIDVIGIREEVDTFMFEGHDTVSEAMQYMLMMIANNSNVQDLIYEEIQNVFGDDFSDITIEKLNELKYMERCIKESLRLYPSVPFIGRELTEDIQIGEYMIPAGTYFDVNVFDLHRDPNIYPNPEKFDPDRFLPENCAKRHNYAYLPFSAGPRNCIGQKFAIFEIKTVMSCILKYFKLEPVTRPDDVIFFVDLVLRSKDSVVVKFVPRN